MLELFEWGQEREVHNIICLNDTPTCCRNCSRKPALLCFFCTGGFVGAAAAAAAAKVGNPGSDAGGLATTDESVADVEDGSFDVLIVLDVSSHRIRGCFFLSLSGLEDTLLESLQSAAFFLLLRALDLDDIVDFTVLS